LFSTEWVWAGAWTCVLGRQQWEVRVPSPVPSPGCCLAPGAGAQDLARRSVSGWGSGKQDLLALTESKRAPGSLSSFQEFLLLLRVYSVPLDAAQGTDILICGMDSRSSLTAAVEGERGMLFSVLFNQFIWMLQPTGCSGSCRQAVLQAKLCEWDSMGTGVQGSLAPRGTGLLPQPFLCPRAHRDSFVNPSPCTAEQPPPGIAYLMPWPVA